VGIFCEKAGDTNTDEDHHQDDDDAQEQDDEDSDKNEDAAGGTSKGNATSYGPADYANRRFNGLKVYGPATLKKVKASSMGH